MARTRAIAIRGIPRLFLDKNSPALHGRLPGNGQRPPLPLLGRPDQRPADRQARRTKSNTPAHRCSASSTASRNGSNNSWKRWPESRPAISRPSPTSSISHAIRPCATSAARPDSCRCWSPGASPHALHLCGSPRGNGNRCTENRGSRTRRSGLGPAARLFRRPAPKADVITMGMILHDWNLEKKLHLISAAYDALPPGGAFVAIENLIDDARRENAFGLMMSLNMLIEFGDAFDFTAADFIGSGAPRPASAARKSSTWRVRRAPRSHTNSGATRGCRRGSAGWPAYVFRSAAAGSIRAARQAGPAIDSAAVTAITIVTSANVVGSSGRTPNSIVSIRRPLNAASTRPIATPVPTTRRAPVEHEPEDVVGRRAERAAHAEITHALLDRIGEDAEDSDHRQDQRQPRKRHHHHGAEPMTARSPPTRCPRASGRSRTLTSCSLSTREIAARTAGASASAAAGLRPHHEKDIVRQILGHRHIELNEVVGLIRTALDLPRDADDLADVRLWLPATTPAEAPRAGRSATGRRASARRPR